ncbi:MAG TPA: hypothetical protein VKT99_22155 [Xanthobacteraceae bacterium]|jgi:hypothetical protein|nr:hypothetical protein [Xanthobacteraceae bacterium]
MRIGTKHKWTRRRGADRARIAARAAAGLLACHVAVSACDAAMAQTPGPEAPSAPTNAPAPPQPQGFFDALGNWVQQGVATVGSGFGAMVGAVGGQANQAAKEAADAARNAATSVTKLPVSGITTGRERCILAPNGAPDCRTAAETLCRAKGYAAGTSVDFETVEKCPPRSRVSARNAPEGVCTLEHFVTKALCQ